MRVWEYRHAAGLTVADLAVRVGLSKAMISKIENAQTSCSLTTLARLADGLEVPVTALFRGVDADREAVFVPAGSGARIIRRGSRVGHQYALLGSLRGAHKRLEAVLVTLTEASEVATATARPVTGWSRAMPCSSTARARMGRRSSSPSRSASCP